VLKYEIEPFELLGHRNRNNIKNQIYTLRKVQQFLTIAESLLGHKEL
jgi:hypothetical protein